MIINLHGLEAKPIECHLEQLDMLAVTKTWSMDNPLLVNMQDQPLFTDKRCWDDLSFHHFNILILLHLNLLLDIDLIMAPTLGLSLRLVLCAMAVKLKNNTMGNITQIDIRRLSASKININYQSAMPIVELPKPKHNFKIIVDNT